MPPLRSDPLPQLDGVQHGFVTMPDGVTIHVADAGPKNGPAVMLLHGFPQHWWQWRALIGPLAADGYRVLVPDLRGAGWSEAPRWGYQKAEMAGDLVAVLDALEISGVRIAAHDWGGPVGFIMMLEHPERVDGLIGFNTVAPWFRVDRANLAHLWSFFYQYPLACPGIGPGLIGSERQRYLYWLVRWVRGGFLWSENDLRVFLERLRDQMRARAGSRWYRSFQAREVFSWLAGRYAGARVEAPVRFVTGLRDPVITPALHHGYEKHASDIGFEHVPEAGHWIVEQSPDLVLDRLRRFLAGQLP